jgi:hypothetical protein
MSQNKKNKTNPVVKTATKTAKAPRGPKPDLLLQAPDLVTVTLRPVVRPNGKKDIDYNIQPQFTLLAGAQPGEIGIKKNGEIVFKVNAPQLLGFSLVILNESTLGGDFKMIDCTAKNELKIKVNKLPSSINDYLYSIAIFSGKDVYISDPPLKTYN